MVKKKVTMITTFIMDDSPESIENFKDFENSINSGEAAEILDGEGWSNVEISLNTEPVEE